MGEHSQDEARLSSLAEAGDAEACYRLSLQRQSRPAERLAWLNRAASLGLAKAALELAHLYEYANWLKRDLVTAAGWYEQAAENGDPEACFVLSSMCSRGHLVAKDRERAKALAREAAEQGHAGAALNLAQLLLDDGKGQEAAKWAWTALESDPEPDVAAWAQDLLESIDGMKRLPAG